MQDGQQPPGWYPAQGDPPGTVRWWDGSKWVGGPQTQGAQQQAGYVAPGAGMLANGRELADPWLRIAAAIIDGILIALVSIPFVGVAIFSGGFDQNDTFTVDTGGFVLTALAGLITTGYVVGMNTYFSGTVGKLLLGLRIVGRNGEEPLGIPLGPKRSANHIVGFVLGLVPILNILVGIAFFLLDLVSLVFLFSDPEHRTVMDRFADTYVVKKA